VPGTEPGTDSIVARAPGLQRRSPARSRAPAAAGRQSGQRRSRDPDVEVLDLAHRHRCPARCLAPPLPGRAPRRW